MGNKKAKILVVDDEPDMVKMLTMSLENASYEVVDAYNGKEGLKKVRKEKPDVIVLDLMMPEMDGFEMCKLIKNDPELENIPVIVLTAIGQQFSHTRYAKNMGLELESEDFITKPVDPNMLIERIEDFLDKK